MKPPAFDYARPDTLDEALALLAEFGPDATLLAGGMSLGAMLNMRLVRPGIVIDLNRVPDLDRVERLSGSLRTGAMMRQARAMGAADLTETAPMLAQALPHVGHFQTRNRGTLGGSVAHADPSAEVPLCLVATGGSVRLASKRGARDVPAEEFFHGMLTTARTPDEMIVALDWPVMDGRVGDGFCEIAQRRGDFAIAAAAARARIDENGNLSNLRFAIGCVEDRPQLIDTTEFQDAPANGDTVQAVAESAAQAVEPIEDLQANANYRRHLVGVLGGRALSEAFANARLETARA